MTAAMIAQLLIAFGPSAIQLIQQLNALWNKPSLTTDEVNQLCQVALTPAFQGLKVGSTGIPVNP